MIVEGEAEPFARGVVELLKEYTRKLDARLTESRAAKARTKAVGNMWFGSEEHQVLARLVNSLTTPLRTATREASELAEQGAVSDLTKFELRIRLAEVEGLIDAVLTQLNSG